MATIAASDLLVCYPSPPILVLRGAIVIRTHDVPKNPYIPLFLHNMFGPDYYEPS